MFARHLQSHRRSYLLVEANDRVGGRMQTDSHQGFLLDRGFQVYLDSYDQGLPYLSLPELGLGYFTPGAYVQSKIGRCYFGDPLREPSAFLSTLHSPIACPIDKWRLFLLSQRLKHRSDREIWSAPEVSTSAYLKSLGFSQRVLKCFLASFFGGVFLDDSLGVSSRLFCFLYKRFSLGRACLPRDGMAAIPRQLANGLDPHRLLLQQQVADLDGCEIRTHQGMVLRGRKVVLAVDQPSATALMGQARAHSDRRSTRVYYFSTPEPPELQRPALLLNGTFQGPIRHLSFPSQVQSHYAPRGQHLVSITTRNDDKGQVVELDEQALRSQIWDTFGINSQAWSFLRSYHVPFALPILRSMPGPGFTQCRDQVWMVGDHMTYPSINGAFESANQLASHLLAK